jgi:2-(1,2-epoxy-1,2-dihydrophenyl)acetyl-CoA isomerase
MMAHQSILYALEGGIARLTLNRPDKLNAFNAAMHEEVADALDQAIGDGARVLLLTGAGRGFSAGQDLSNLSEEEKRDPGHPLEHHYNPLMRKLAALPFPFLCAVNGVAAGAGANIALGADIVIAARSAKFIQSFVHVGLAPDAGGTWTLPRLAGQARAMGLMLTGEALSAEKAEAWGLIWKVVDDAALMDEANALALRLAAAPTKSLAAIRGALRGSWDNTLEQQLTLERELQRQMGLTHDYREGVMAFLEKRTPKFTGR